MKKSILPLLFALISISAYSQAKLHVSFADFQAWAKQVKIPGYPYLESEQDGADYSAMFGNGPEKAFQMRLMPLASFNDYKAVSKNATAYSLNGLKAVFYTFANTSLLSIELPQAQACISFAQAGTLPQSTLEGYALKANLHTLKPSGFTANAPGVKWPDVIPADIRIAGVESIQSQGSDGTYKEVIEVKASMSTSLVTSVETILRKYNGELSLTKTPQVDFACAVAESIDQLKTSLKNGQPVMFMYYIK